MSDSSKITTLSNGITLISEYRSGYASVAISAMVKVGSRYETKENKGVTHFLEHLLFKGSLKYSTPETSNSIIESTGGYINAYTTQDRTSFDVRVPNSSYPKAIEYLADILINPLFNPIEVNKERHIVVEEMRMHNDDIVTSMFDKAPSLIWANQEISNYVMGDEDSINTISIDDIARYHFKHYCGKNLVLVAVGAVDHGKFVETAEKYFSAMHSGEANSHISAKLDLSKNLVEYKQMQTSQTHMLLSLPAVKFGHKDFADFRMLTNYLGGGMSSRLFIRLREELAIAYETFCSMALYSDVGRIDIYSGTTFDKLPEALSATLDELSKVKFEYLTENDITDLKNKVIGKEIMRLDDLSYSCDKIATEWTLSAKITSTESEIESYKLVDPDSINSFTNKYIDASNKRIVIVGDKETIDHKELELVE